jgi:hypothetical protein
MRSLRKRAGWFLILVALLAALGVTSARVVRSLMATRRAVATYVAILSAVNAQDLEALGPLCTDRYLRAHPPARSSGGGVVGLPRGIHKNFQAWREGDEVWLCPTDRVGPVYRFVFEGGACKLDGLAGLLRPGGRVERAAEAVDDFF